MIRKKQTRYFRQLENVKLTEILPLLELVAFQNNLTTSKNRELLICKTIVEKSINQN